MAAHAALAKPSAAPATAVSWQAPAACPEPELARTPEQSAQWLAFLGGHGIHPKLTVSNPGDPDERDADAMADRVMSQREPTGDMAPITPSSSTAALARKCSGCEREDEDENRIARAAESSAAVPAAAVADAASAVASGGMPLPAAELKFFEPRFGRDLRGIRVHTGPQAHRAATGINALAYSHGRNIAFANGQYAPGCFAGRKLLAHEMAHVVQSYSNVGAVRRKACGHDSSKGPGCGGGALARWNLVNIVTQEVENIALDDKIVREGLQGRFGTNWVTQITTPPNPVKSGVDSGRIDGARVSGAGDLKIEIVEVKSRSTTYAGGCALATREAQGYVDVLKPLGPTIIDISAKLAPVGGLRVPLGKQPLADDLLVLNAAGINLNEKTTKQAWTFYNGLQNRLDRTFTSAFTGFVPQLFADGTPGEDYNVGLPVAVECQKKGKPGIKPRQLKFQVNGKGGVSYRCDDGPCRTKEEEEEEEKKRQPRQLPVAQPQAQPQGQPKGKQDNVPGEDDKDKPPTENPWITNPLVLTGAATGTALTAAAIATARARAKRIAEERIAKELLERAAAKAAEEQAKRAAAKNVINLAERRLAKEAAAKGLERGAGRRLAGKAAGKALLYAEVAAFVLVVFSGKAEAKVGFGPSAFEALYDIMRQNGHEPSPEMKELIENDPVLKQLAEQAGSGGDPTALQEEATKRMMELVRDNPGEFTVEELEILRQASNAGAGGGSAKTAAELRAAIDRAVAMQGKQPSTGGDSENKTPGGGGGSDSSTPDGGSASPGSAAPAGGEQVSSGDLPGQVEATRKKYPGLSTGMAAELAAAPPAVRALFEAMTGPGKGIKVDDELLGLFLATVPIDLSIAEKDKLVANLKPIADESAADVIDRLASAVEAARAPQSTKPGDKPGDAAGSPDAAKPDKAAPDKVAADQQPGQPAADKDSAAQGGGQAADKQGEADPDANDRTIQMLRKALKDYQNWDKQPGGTLMWVGKLAQAKGTEVGLYGYAKSTNGMVRAVVFVHVRITRAASKPGETWAAKVLSSTPSIQNDGTRFTRSSGFAPGTTISGTLQ